MEWLGHAKIDFTHAPSPRPLRQKDGQKTDILKVVEQATPPCRLNPLLFNGHAQTMWTATKPKGPLVYYKRKIFDADHKTYQGTFAVDFAVPEFEETDESLPRRTLYYSEGELASIGSDDNKPMLVILHGLSGGSHEIYLRHTIAPLLGDGGWEACVINSRGCARSKITSGVLYNARATWDCRQVIKWLREKYPNRPLFAIGFSLGANILTNVSVHGFMTLLVIHADYDSIVAKRERTAFSKPRWFVPIRLTLRLRARFWRADGSAGRCTYAPWAVRKTPSIASFIR